MIMLWVFLFPLLAGFMLGYFIYRWKKAVKAGLFQKVKFPGRKR